MQHGHTCNLYFGKKFIIQLSKITYKVKGITKQLAKTGIAKIQSSYNCSEKNKLEEGGKNGKNLFPLNIIYFL